jgi:hypothetical protein
MKIKYAKRIIRSNLVSAAIALAFLIFLIAGQQQLDAASWIAVAFCAILTLWGSIFAIVAGRKGYMKIEFGMISMYPIGPKNFCISDIREVRKPWYGGYILKSGDSEIRVNPASIARESWPFFLAELDKYKIVLEEPVPGKEPDPVPNEMDNED